MKSKIRGEWTKFISSRWCVAGVCIAIFLQPILLFAGILTVDIPTSNIALEQLLQALYISQTGIIIMSAGFFGQEYFDSSLRTTFLASSRRINGFIAKALILAFVSISAWAMSVGLGIVIAMIYEISFAVRDFLKIGLTVLSWVMMGWISGFVAVILKSHLISIIIFVPSNLAVNQMLAGITDVYRFFPDIAARNAFTISPGTVLLQAQTGLAVQAIWTLATGALAMWLNSRRDVR